ncbi:MAG TPA: GNVR domain-containing protein, partial [Gammaproteobacteria bacterium]|nr:GNVR domain-containing protein [Gammaproteobacteria bacterium]
QSMEEKVDQIIDAETKLSNLNRDYSMNKAQYNALLEKRDAAKLVEDIDGTSENLTFRIIEPPYASSLPVWPKRNLFNLVVLVASLLGGVASTFVLAQWKPAFYDKISLEKALNLPVLAVIPQEKNHIKRKISLKLNLLYVICILGLWGGFMLLYYMQRQGVMPT